MATTYRVGVIGFAHMHVNDLIHQFAVHPQTEWVACADTVPAVKPLSTKPSTRAANLRRAQEVTGIPKVYDDYREMLANEKLDIVIACPENARHGEVIEAIAAAGAHIVTEKPMAASLSEALHMVRSARNAGVKLMINWPIAWTPAMRALKPLLEAGTIGDVLELKWRNGPSMGPLAYNKGDDVLTGAEKGSEWWHQSAPGGGVLLDYCCYGACLSNLLIGPATAASGLKANLDSHYGEAEDNAIITVRFPKAIAILEASWTTWANGVANGPVIHGKTGTLVVNSRVNPDTGKSSQVVEVYTTRGAAPGSPDQIIEGEALPAGRATLAEEFIHHIETGEPLYEMLDPEINLGAMAILDAGIRSAASGKVELVNDASWSIG